MSTPAIDLRGKRAVADGSFRLLALASGLLVLLILALIAVVMTRNAWPAFQEMGLSFFTSDTWSPANDEFGALAFIYGTVISSALALLFAVPVSLGIALFTTQVAPQWLKRPIVYTVDLLAVVPSVVFGLWGVLVLAPWLFPIFNNIHDVVGDVPLLGTIFGPASSGRTFMTAGIILAIMIIPIVTSLSREVIETTPPGEKEAALALGATRWEMIRGSVFPHSKGGLVGSVMLGLGRAMGETIAVALVIGSAPQITANLFAPGDSMPAVIANQWGEADSLHKAALLALAVVLFLITILVNILASYVVSRSLRKSQGARA